MQASDYFKATGRKVTMAMQCAMWADLQRVPAYARWSVYLAGALGYYEIATAKKVQP